MKKGFHLLGLHPAVAFIMILVDFMLFGSDVTGVGWGISCLVAAILVIPVILFQRYAYKDSWGVAIGKGIVVGLLTAIPTALPSFFTGIGGLLGLAGGSSVKQLEQQNVSDN